MNIRSSILPFLFLTVGISAASIDRARAEVALTPVSPAAPLPSYMKGVNLSGAEYAPKATGVFGTNYIYPTNQEFDYYSSKGFSVIRLPFDIARAQPVSLQPLNQSELAHITAAVEYARKKGMYIILDPHNYGRMWSATTNSYQEIGTSSYIPNSYFADFWQRLATVYKNYPNVLYGLMNEPNVQNPAQWKASAVAAINAIRTVSATQTILIPGTYFTTAATWTFNGNSAAWTGYRDPVGGPFMFEMHQYLDSNYSGTSDVCVPGSGSSVLTATTNWLAANGYKAFLGEFDWYNNFGGGGVGTVSAQCQTEGTALLNAMQNAPNQWAGWTWWGSGPWAWNNGVNLDPGADGIPGDQPQTGTLIQFLSFQPPSSASSATFVKFDTTTRGSWPGVYGADGYIVSQDASTKIPNYAKVSFAGALNWVWLSSTADTRALQRPENLSSRIAATWYTWGSLSISTNLTDGNPHQVALYLLDWDSTARAETITVTDATTGAVLDTRVLPVGTFNKGEYAVWTVKGNVKFQVARNQGANAVVSGIFFR